MKIYLKTVLVSVGILFYSEVFATMALKSTQQNIITMEKDDLLPQDITFSVGSVSSADYTVEIIPSADGCTDNLEIDGKKLKGFVEPLPNTPNIACEFTVKASGAALGADLEQSLTIYTLPKVKADEMQMIFEGETIEPLDISKFSDARAVVTLGDVECDHPRRPINGLFSIDSGKLVTSAAKAVIPPFVRNPPYLYNCSVEILSGSKVSKFAVTLIKKTDERFFKIVARENKIQPTEDLLTIFPDAVNGISWFYRMSPDMFDFCDRNIFNEFDGSKLLLHSNAFPKNDPVYVAADGTDTIINECRGVIETSPSSAKTVTIFILKKLP